MHQSAIADGVDKDPKSWKRYGPQMSIHEPGLDEILRSALAEGALNFTTEIAEAVEDRRCHIHSGGHAVARSGAYDFSYVEAAARQIGRALRAGKSDI